MSDKPVCEVCGEPMPQGEEMFKFHGYSGPCPKPPKPNPEKERYAANMKINAPAMSDDAIPAGPELDAAVED